MELIAEKLSIRIIPACFWDNPLRQSIHHILIYKKKGLKLTSH